MGRRVEGRTGYLDRESAPPRNPVRPTPLSELTMPALLIRAAQLFGLASVARTIGGAVLRRPALAGAVAGGAGLAAFGAQQAITIGGNGLLGGLKPRRRRRRALTADDMRTALTIASAISKKAAENFVLQRTRR